MLGVAFGHFYPSIGTDLKPLCEGFNKRQRGLVAGTRNLLTSASALNPICGDELAATSQRGVDVVRLERSSARFDLKVRFSRIAVTRA